MPVSDNGGDVGDCYVWEFSTMWKPHLKLQNTEDICRLLPHRGDLVALSETNEGIMALHNGRWETDFNYAGKPYQYGTFDGVLVGDHLWTAVTGYDRNTPITLLKRIAFKLYHQFVFTPGIQDQRPTIWALGTDGVNLFVGIAGFGRGINENSDLDGIWKIDLHNPANKSKESGVKAQSFCQVGNNVVAGATGGGVYIRNTSGWMQLFWLDAKVVVSIARVGGYTYYGTALPGLLYRGKGLETPKRIKNCGQTAHVGVYRGKAVVSWNDGINHVDWV